MVKIWAALYLTCPNALGYFCLVLQNYKIWITHTETWTGLNIFRNYAKLKFIAWKWPCMHTDFFAFCLEKIEEIDLHHLILSKARLKKCFRRNNLSHLLSKGTFQNQILGCFLNFRNLINFTFKDFLSIFLLSLNTFKVWVQVNKTFRSSDQKGVR